MGNYILRLTLLSMKDGSISYPTPYVGETEERFQFKNWIRFIKLNPAFRPSWDLNPWPLNFIYLKSLFIFFLGENTIWMKLHAKAHKNLYLNSLIMSSLNNRWISQWSQELITWPPGAIQSTGFSGFSGWWWLISWGKVLWWGAVSDGYWICNKLFERVQWLIHSDVFMSCSKETLVLVIKGM